MSRSIDSLHWLHWVWVSSLKTFTKATESQHDKNMNLFISAELNVISMWSSRCHSSKVTQRPEEHKLNPSNSEWMSASYLTGFTCLRLFLASGTEGQCRCLGQWPESSLICMLTMDPRIKTSLLYFSSPVPAGHWLPTIPPLNAANVLSVLNKCISLVLMLRSINVMDRCIEGSDDRSNV